MTEGNGPDVPHDAWAGVHRGPLRAGEWVRLTDQKGRRHNFELVPGKRPEVALFWQHWRLGSTLVDELTDAVVHAARRWMATPR